LETDFHICSNFVGTLLLNTPSDMRIFSGVFI